MKKVLAAVLAAAMSLSMASVAFAATSTIGASGIISVTKPSNGSYDYVIGTNLSDAAVENKGELNVKNDLIWTYDDDEMTLYFEVETGGKMRADVSDGKVSVSIKRLERNVASETNYGKNVDKYKLTVKAKWGPKDYGTKDWTVELDINGDKMVYLKGKGGYSDTQTVSSGDRLVVSKSKKGIEDGSTGAIFNFSEVLDDEVRIRCNDYVDVYFKGNYGTDKENMRVKDDKIDDLKNFFGDEDIDCYDFIGTPKFATKVKVIIDGDQNSIPYEYNKSTGEVTRIADAEYTSDGWSFTTNKLGTYVLTEEEYADGNVDKEEVNEPTSEPTTAPTEKDNPGTGANDMVGAAAALAVVSLVAAGAVAFKKASK